MHIHTKTLFKHKIMLHSRVPVILEVLINFEADNNRVALPGTVPKAMCLNTQPAFTLISIHFDSIGSREFQMVYSNISFDQTVKVRGWPEAILSASALRYYFMLFHVYFARKTDIMQNCGYR